MYRTGSQFTDSVLVLWCTITLVLSESVAGIFCFQFLHKSVSMSFGDNGCGSNGEIDSIPFVESVLGNGNAGNSPGIDEYMFGCQWKSFDRSTHGEERSMIDVEMVDLANLRYSNADSCCCLSDRRCQFDSLLGFELFRIVNPGKLGAWWKNHRRCYHRAGQRSYSNFVHACNRADA